MLHQFNQNTRFLDKSFNEQNTRSYVLSVLFDKYGFSFCVYHPANNKIIGLINHHFKEAESETGISTQFDIILSNFPWLGFAFLRVHVLFQSNVNTLVPLPLFNAKHTALYLEFNHPHQEGHRIVYDNVKHSDAVNIYSLPDLIVEKIKTSWPNVLFKHASTCLLESLHVLIKNKGDNNSLFLNVETNRFELVYFKDNKLHFYNQFAFNTKEDFIYFLLTAIEQLKLNPETVRLVLSGMIDKNDSRYEIAYRYIRQLSFLERNDSFLYSHVLNEIKPHKYFVLFNSLQCE